MTKHLLPQSALAHHIGVLGKTGSGKTSVVKAAIIEPALKADERICVIDPTGAWWGLRLNKDGRSKGFPVYVFGGRHADYPLLASHGEALADVIGSTNTPAILDTSLMKIGERVRFFTEFSDAILRKNQGPLRLVIDEAHIFMPQAGARGGGPVPDMLHAGNNLISLGRSRGLRAVLITQRAAKLHKDSLTQVETMIACRLIAPQDRHAFREWVADQADVEAASAIIASLPKLADGEGWVWAPEADFLKRIQFPRPSTYDSSAAPTKAAATKKLSPIDLDKLKGRLAKVDEEAKANDVPTLRAQIIEQKRKISALETELTYKSTAKADPQALQKAEQRGIDRAKKAAEKAARAVLINTLRDIQASIEAVCSEAMAKARAASVDADLTAAAPIAPPPPAAAPAPRAALRVVRSRPDGAASLPPTVRKILDEIHRAHPMALSFESAALRAGVSRRSSAYRTYRQQVESSPEILTRPTDRKLYSAPGYAAPVEPGRNPIEAFASRLPPSYASMLRVIAASPTAMSKEQIAEAAGVSVTSSGLSGGLRELSELGLIERNGDAYAIHHEIAA